MGYLLQQIEVLQIYKLASLNLDARYILPFTNNDGIFILNAFLNNNKQGNVIFSCGLIALEMCFGFNPVKDENSPLSSDFLYSLFKNKHYSTELKEIIIKLLIDKELPRVEKKYRYTLTNKSKMYRAVKKLSQEKKRFQYKKLCFYGNK